MNKNLKWGWVLVLSLILLFFISFSGVKFIKHEKSQQERITNLEGKVNLLQAESEKSTVEWNLDDYNYLAIGNSITIHPLNDYWWNECGMAATTMEKDFVNQVAIALNAKSYAYNFATWEMIGHDRGETLSLLDGLLSEELDLVTIQLSENVSDLSTLEPDFEELIRYVQKGAQNAQIIVVGDFWDKEQKDKIKRQACEATDVVFVSLDEIKGLEEYQCGFGTTVYDKEGNPHTVEHSGVAKHPNDAGMKWIAGKILEISK